jgi:ABC-2 type transport system ATP-binding protein
MRQHALIATTLLHDPKLLIFSTNLSPDLMLSPRLFKDLFELLTARGKAVLYISHVLEVVEQICNCVIVIAKSKILADARIRMGGATGCLHKELPVRRPGLA